MNTNSPIGMRRKNHDLASLLRCNRSLAFLFHPSSLDSFPTYESTIPPIVRHGRLPMPVLRGQGQASQRLALHRR